MSCPDAGATILCGYKYSTSSIKFINSGLASLGRAAFLGSLGCLEPLPSLPLPFPDAFLLFTPGAMLPFHFWRKLQAGCAAP